MFNLLLRRDGFRRATFAVKFHVDAELAATILASSDLDQDDIPGKGETEETIRADLARKGREHFIFCHENYEEDEWSESFAWATKVIGTHWPRWNFEKLDIGS